MSEPLKVAVVGHSNVGKTSLVAALTRDASLEVREEAGTTRSHYSRAFVLGGEPVIAFVDTPGFETAGRINRWIDREAGDDAPDGRTLLERFLADDGTDEAFREEKEALRGALEADVLAYVADVTTDPSGQQRQEVRLLRRAGVPVIAVLNVLAEGDRRDAWTDLLRRENVDTVVPLDAWDFSAEQEAHFYRALGVLKPEMGGALDRVVSLRGRQGASSRRAAARAVGELLVDTLAFRLEETHGSQSEGRKKRDEANAAFKRRLRRREQQGFEELASLYGFPELDVQGESLTVESWSGTWQGDLFDPKALRRYGVSAGTLGLIGAVTGSALDAVGGMGVGTVIGGAVGLGAGFALGRRVSTSVDGRGKLTVGPVDSVQFPSLLAHRALELWAHLSARSHARRDDIALDESGPRLSTSQTGRLNKLARRCGKNPRWSRLEAGAELSAERDGVVADLAELIAAAMEA
jgi:GTPase SAR1 family protein